MNAINETPDVQQLPLNVYAGFWPRLGSLFLDVIFILPVGLVIAYINHFDRDNYFYTMIPALLFFVWYEVYLVKINGGTPGKLIMGIKMIQLDGQSVAWKQAWLRESVGLFFRICTTILTTLGTLQLSHFDYPNPVWYQDNVALRSNPTAFMLLTFLSVAWGLSELIFLLTNEKKRALHDYIAGTVVVKIERLNMLAEEEVPN